MPSQTRQLTFITALTFLFTIGYAILRYLVFGNVAWADLPIFILNKAVSWSAVLLFCLIYVLRPLSIRFPLLEQYLILRKWLGFIGLSFVFMHLIFSLMILNPAYFPTFFDGDRFSWIGSINLFFATIAILLLMFPTVTSLPSIERDLPRDRWLFWQSMGKISLIFTLLHVSVIGVRGWLNPAGWHGHLPPITLLSVLPILLMIGIRALIRQK